MNLTDIHFHGLWGVDDGPKDEKTMQAMVDAAYTDGIRTLCLTPHFHPGFFGHNESKSLRSFEALAQYAAGKYPDLRLCLGNELRYSPECTAWLADGPCRTLNGTDYVLVDFYAGESARNISRGLDRILNAGYLPVLAHAERYSALNTSMIQEFSHNGIRIQLNAGSLQGDFGYGARFRSHSLLRAHLVDLVCSDAHDLYRRPPGLSKAYRVIKKKYGKDCADALCHHNALALLCDPGKEGMVNNHEST